MKEADPSPASAVRVVFESGQSALWLTQAAARIPASAATRGSPKRQRREDRGHQPKVPDPDLLKYEPADQGALTLRLADLDARFPGFLDSIISSTRDLDVPGLIEETE